MMSQTEEMSTTKAPSRGLGRLFKGEARPVAVAYLVSMGVFVAATLISSNFASSNNISTLLLQASFIGIAALGQTFVILGGGLDLSVPWVMTAAAIIVSRVTDGTDNGLIWAIPLILLMALVVGLINGIGVTKFKVSPIIMTLGMSGIIQGAVLVYTNGTGSPESPPALVWLEKNGIGPFTYTTIIWLVMAVVASIVLMRTSYGRKLYATGSNATVARLSGIRTSNVTIITYMISAFTAAVAGLLLLGFTGSPYLSLGSPYLFTSIAAVAVGGTSILGGRGSYIGTIAGALLITLLGAFLPILNLSVAALPIIYGVVILVAVAIASGRYSKSSL